jgi:DNA-binding GntR family transcriptional regulator
MHHRSAASETAPLAESVAGAYDAIRTAIVSGRFPPGAHLTETSLASELRMSRTPVREALKRLAGEQLVDMVAGRGAYVADLRRGRLSEMLALRAVVEPYCMEVAAGRAGDRDLELWEEAAGAVASADGAAALDDAYVRFLRSACAAAKSDMLTAVVNIALATPVFSLLELDDRAAPARTAAAVVAAVRARDGALAAATHRALLLQLRAVALAREELRARELAAITPRRSIPLI